MNYMEKACMPVNECACDEPKSLASVACISSKSYDVIRSIMDILDRIDGGMTGDGLKRPPSEDRSSPSSLVENIHLNHDGVLIIRDRLECLYNQLLG